MRPSALPSKTWGKFLQVLPGCRDRCEPIRESKFCCYWKCEEGWWAVFMLGFSFHLAWRCLAVEVLKPLDLFCGLRIRCQGLWKPVTLPGKSHHLGLSHDADWPLQLPSEALGTLLVCFQGTSAHRFLITKTIWWSSMLPTPSRYKFLSML